MTILRLDPIFTPFILAVLVVLLPASGDAFGQIASVDIPANAVPKSSDIGWECESGYKESSGRCIEIKIPMNASLTNLLYGVGWRCHWGFYSKDGACARIEVPANGYLSSTEFGRGWRCKRGYLAVSDICVAINVPENVYLNDSGKALECDYGSQMENSKCFKIDAPEEAR